MSNPSKVYTEVWTRVFMLMEIHGRSFTENFGEDKTYMMAKEYYYWPHMLRDVQDIIKRCFTITLLN